MNWTGKLIGALLGFILTRRPMGVLLGLFLGHLYDQYAARGHAGSRADPATVRATFFRAAFTIMGHVAKSDGRVSEQDIAAARRIFRQFNLGEADTRAAMEFYTLGKRPDFENKLVDDKFLRDYLEKARGYGLEISSLAMSATASG